MVGLAPAAHGGNRTGRIFTGDRSGDFLYASMHRAGLANRPTSESRDDGLRLRGAYVAAVNRCAPPETGRRRSSATPACRSCVARSSARTAPRRRRPRRLRLGRRARALAHLGHRVRPRPPFGHAAEAEVGPFAMLGCFHPSQQNTFTGKLTPEMLDAVFARAKELALAPVTRRCGAPRRGSGTPWSRNAARRPTRRPGGPCLDPPVEREPVHLEDDEDHHARDHCREVDPAPARMPSAAAAHDDAAVVRPSTNAPCSSSRSRKIRPAPRNPPR